MKKLPFHAVRRSTKRQTGVAAVELALLLPILVPFLTLGYFTVSIFWHYTMAQKAAQDAARYLSTVPVAEMLTGTPSRAAGLLAEQIVRREIADSSPESEVSPILTFCDVTSDASINCGATSADGKRPTAVQVYFTITMVDPFGFVDTGWYGLKITANSTMRYVGN
jgi:Flp pilus assembly protein TadG